MPTAAVAYECQSCGEIFAKWQGKCDACQQWNTLVESKKQKLNKKTARIQKKSQAKPLADVETEQTFYYKTAIKEFDDVLGDGLVKGSVVLLGGEPGVGKSTLSLQVCQQCAQTGKKVLYITAEESESQIKLRAQRLGAVDDLWVYAETNMQSIIDECEQLKPDIVLLDSIQVVQHPELNSLEGTVAQVRYCASALISWVKNNNKSAIMIGHITKDGQIAGPKVLEHLVDVILYLEGDRHYHYRILRCQKNRYGSTDNIGLFEMKASGLNALEDPSKAFIEHIDKPTPGSVIAPFTEGNRVILIEIQALVVESGYGMAKRNFVGVNPNRANLLIASLDKRLRLKLATHDIFLTVIGGLTVNDPSIDLAIIVAIMSSLWQQPIDSQIGLCGEVGLTGEVRPISHIDKRIKECEKCGISTCVVPEKNNISFSDSSCFKIIKVQHVLEVLENIFKKQYETTRNE